MLSTVIIFISYTVHVIDSQEVFPWVRNVNAEISLFSTKKKNDRSALLKLIDVNLLESHLTINGLNVEINNVYLGHWIVSVYKKTYQEGEKYFNVSNSTIGHLSISDGFQVTISNCFIDGRTRLSETLIRVTNCILTIQDSMFYNFKSHYNSPAILKAMFSLVYIRDIFCSNNVGSVGLIQILNGSKLFLANSDFEDNGNIFTLSTISIKYHSSAVVFNSTFVSNSAVDGAALNCYFNSSIEVKMSGFYGNTAAKGGAIICEDKIENVFSNNLNVDSSSRSSCVISECFFEVGIAMNAGHLYLKRVFATIVKTVFGVGWIPIHGGAIAAVDHTQLNILNCTFGISNYIMGGPMAVIGAIIYSQNEVTIDIRRSIIHTNLPVFNGLLLFATDRCKIIIKDSYITDSYEVPAFTIALCVENFTEISVVDSVFDTRLGFGLTVLSSANNVKVNFTNCIFKRVTGFVASSKTKIYVTNCVISECINTLPAMIFFKLLDRCSIYIQHTDITHNKFLGGHGFLLAEVHEDVMISNCMYTNNSASSHFFITGNSTVFISHSQFLYNNITKTYKEDKKGLITTDHTDVNL